MDLIIKNAILIFTLWVGIPLVAFADINADEIIGVWLVENGDGFVEIERKGSQYYGTIIGAPEGTRDPDERDTKNKDPKLRDRLLNGLLLMGEYKFNGKRWVKGWVYDPHTGKRYKSRLTLKDSNTLKVRGYVGTPRVGKTKVWTRKNN